MGMLNKIFRWIAGAVAMTLVATPAFGADPILLKDISTSNTNSSINGATPGHLYWSQGKTYVFDSADRPATFILPNEIDGEFFAFGNVALFGYNDGVHGQELWRSDGTQAGTYLVKDLVEGPQSSRPRTFVQWRGNVYFTTPAREDLRDPARSDPPQLWRTDGTPNGTQLVLNLDTYVGPSEDVDDVWGDVVSLIAGRDKLFFNIDNAGWSFTLWQSDGTAAGTAEMVNAEDGKPVFATNLLQSVGGATYFADNQPFWSDYAYDWTIGKLWRIDGSGQGLATITDALASPAIGVFEGRVYFLIHKDAGLYLARTDESGTAVETVAFLYPASSSASVIVKFVTSATSLFFGIGGYSLGDIKPAVWRYSGAEKTAVRLTEAEGYVNFESMFIKDDALYFGFNYKLWRSDGTPAGTGPHFMNLATGSPYRFSSAPMGGQVWFTAADDAGLSLFRTDGDTAITKVMAITPVVENSKPHQFITLSDGLTLFRGGNTVLPYTRPSVYATRGTPETTDYAQIGNSWCFNCVVNVTLPVGSGALILSDADARLSYTDGSTLARVVKHPLWPASLKRFPVSKYSLAPLGTNAALFFAVEQNADLSYSRKLWRTDGTAEGTVLVKTFALSIPPSTNLSPPGIEAVVAHKQLVYFMGNDGRNGNELWRSDGTDIGTYMVKDLVPGSTSGLVQHITSARNQVYFTYTDDYGIYLAKSRGSARDTLHIAALPGNAKSIQNATSVNDSLFFRVGLNLYRSNGQRGDLRRLGQFAFNSLGESSYYRNLPASAHPAAMTAYGDHLYFVARKGAKDPLQVWRADTKKNKAEIVSPQFKVRASGANDVSFAVHAGRLFLAAMDRAGQNGGIFELRTRGKTMQWVRHTNMSARELHITGDKMYFAGLDKEFGEEPRVMALPKQP